MGFFTKFNQKKSKALVIFATGSGNSQLVAEALYDGLEDGGADVAIKAAELTSINELGDYDLISIVCSTWDVGKLNPNFIKLNGEMQNIDLSTKFVDVIGLGDSKNYDIFCGAADIIEDTIKTTKAKNILPTLRIDGPPHSMLNQIRDRGRELAKQI